MNRREQISNRIILAVNLLFTASPQNTSTSTTSQRLNSEIGQVVNRARDILRSNRSSFTRNASTSFQNGATSAYPKRTCERTCLSIWDRWRGIYMYLCDVKSYFELLVLSYSKILSQTFYYMLPKNTNKQTKRYHTAIRPKWDILYVFIKLPDQLCQINLEIGQHH